MFAATRHKMVEDFEKLIDKSKYHVMINGSYGDIFLFLAMFRTFMDQVEESVVFYSLPRWNPLIQRYFPNNCEIENLEYHQALDIATSASTSNSFGKLEKGKLFQSVITCHPNLPELYLKGYLTPQQINRFLLGMNENQRITLPPNRNDFVTAARKLLSPEYHKSTLEGRCSVIVSFTNNTTLEIPIEFRRKIINELLKQNCYVVNNVAAPAYGASPRTEKYAGVQEISVPPESACELLDQFDIFISGTNGLVDIARLGTQSVLTVMLTPPTVTTKTADWEYKSDPKFFSWIWEEFDVSRLNLVYFDFNTDPENLDWSFLGDIVYKVYRNKILK
jgi:hypothetical protein